MTDHPHTDEWQRPGCALVLVLAALLCCAAGCTRTELRISETYADGATFALIDKARGDAVTSRQVEYTGDGWRLAVNSDAEIESPAALALAEGLPGIIEELLPVLSFASSVPAAKQPGIMRAVIEAIIRARLAR